MPPEIKLPFALRNGRPIHISHVNSGRQKNCLCPECEQPLIARKPKKRRQHFAHDPGSNCKLESILHWFGKTLIFDGIQKALIEGQQVRIKWNCGQCGDEHTGNLVTNAATVRLEQTLGPAKPDVLLVDSKNKPIVAIEIVVSHSPEERVREYYRCHNIKLVIVKLESETALEALQDLRELCATYVSRCPRKKCPDCSQALSKKWLSIVRTNCNHCGSLMFVSFFRADSIGYPPTFYSPKYFSARDIRVAKDRGCFLATFGNPSDFEPYRANCCRNCNFFVIDLHIDDYMELENATSGQVTGLFCTNCDTSFDHE